MIHHAPEFFHFIAAASLATSGAALAVAHPSADDYVSAVYWSVMPIVGAIMASGMACLLGPERESRKRLLGRALGALTFGVVGPRLAIIWKPDLRDIIQDPILLGASGALCGIIGYAVVSVVINWILVRAPEKVEQQLNKYLHESTQEPLTSRTAIRIIDKLPDPPEP